jgi:FKBP-type peptidyl-prolyl cis-trans isomerase 2
VNPVAAGPGTVVSLKIEMHDAQGALLQASSAFEGGAPRRYTVTDLAGDKAVLDANHPLAGMALRFFCTITAVREATKEELSRREAFYRCDP